MPENTETPIPDLPNQITIKINEQEIQIRPTDYSELAEFMEHGEYNSEYNEVKEYDFLEFKKETFQKYLTTFQKYRLDKDQNITFQKFKHESSFAMPLILVGIALLIVAAAVVSMGLVPAIAVGAVGLASLAYGGLNRSKEESMLRVAIETKDLKIINLPDIKDKVTKYGEKNKKNLIKTLSSKMPVYAETINALVGKMQDDKIAELLNKISQGTDLNDICGNGQSLREIITTSTSQKNMGNKGSKHPLRDPKGPLNSGAIKKKTRGCADASKKTGSPLNKPVEKNLGQSRTNRGP